MKLILSSNTKNFLEIFSPDIIFLDDTRLAETAQDVIYFLEEYGLEKEDLINAGLKMNKNVITIPRGTKAKILATGNGETSLRVKDIEFDFSFTYDADNCLVEVECLDAGREKVFAAYDNRLPKQDDDTILGKYYLVDILEAVAELNFEGRRTNAFEEMKTMTYDEMYIKLDRYVRRLANKLELSTNLDIDTIELETLNTIKELGKNG